MGLVEHAARKLINAKVGEQNFFIEACLAYYLKAVALFRKLSKRAAPEMKLPIFHDPKDVAIYLAWQLPGPTIYGSSVSFDMSPGAVEYVLSYKYGTALQHEDAAVWAYNALEGIPACDSRLFTLFSKADGFTRLVCAYRIGSQCGAIDGRNGHTSLPNLLPDTLKDAYSFIHKQDYIGCLETHNPYAQRKKLL